jgi:hypothetical protein
VDLERDLERDFGAGLGAERKNKTGATLFISSIRASYEKLNHFGYNSKQYLTGKS